MLKLHASQFRLPTRHDLWLFVLWMTSASLLFVTVYGSANWLASLKEGERFHLYFAWERDIPFVPWMIYVYMSLNLVGALPIFFLKENEIRALGRATLISIMLAGIVFILYPTEMIVQRTLEQAATSEHLARVWKFDRPYNLFPSLHITLSALSVFVMNRRLLPATRKLLWLWMFAMCAAILLVHQHQVLDIVGGFLVAGFCYREVYRHEI